MPYIFKTLIGEGSTYELVFGKVLLNLRQNSIPAYVTVNNVHTVVEAVRNKDYNKALKR